MPVNSRTNPQGQLPLRDDTRKDFHQVILVPAAEAAFHGDAVLAGMLLQERQRQAVEPGEVLADVSAADARIVLAERHVEGPIASVFDTPMSARRAGEALNAHFQAADVIT